VNQAEQMKMWGEKRKIAKKIELKGRELKK
jgi:hypothetical protein